MPRLYDDGLRYRSQGADRRFYSEAEINAIGSNWVPWNLARRYGIDRRGNGPYGTMQYYKKN